MDCTLLKLATTRRRGYRAWDGLRLGISTGMVGYGASQCRPKLSGFWFVWNFHAHHGGRGGLAVSGHKALIRERVTNLIAYNG